MMLWFGQLTLCDTLIVMCKILDAIFYQPNLCLDFKPEIKKKNLDLYSVNF